MLKNKDIGFLEAIDSTLDFIVDKVKIAISEYETLDTDDFNFIEINRFERVNIILSNFYKNKDKFDINDSAIADKIINLIYESLAKPYILEGTDYSEIEYFMENKIIEDEDESYQFNNSIFNWYDFTDFDHQHKKELREIINNLLVKNKNNQECKLNLIDVNIYNTIISNPILLSTINWRNFEKLLADILERFEYEVELLKGTKDGGIDIIALKNQSPFGLNRYLIQAKRWKNKVGVEPVRSLLWAHNEYKATKSCLVTTSEFTKGAWALANQYRWQIELKDHEKILDWIRLANKK